MRILKGAYQMSRLIRNKQRATDQYLFSDVRDRNHAFEELNQLFPFASFIKKGDNKILFTKTGSLDWDLRIASKFEKCGGELLKI